jgi:hypothetical protein
MVELSKSLIKLQFRHGFMINYEINVKLKAILHLFLFWHYSFVLNVIHEYIASYK